MAKFVYEVDDSKMPIIEEAFGTAYGYQETVANPDYDPEDENSQATIANPQGPTDFVLEKVQEFIGNVVMAHASNKAVAAATTQAQEAMKDVDLGTVSIETAAVTVDTPATITDKVKDI